MLVCTHTSIYFVTYLPTIYTVHCNNPPMKLLVHCSDGLRMVATHSMGLDKGAMMTVDFCLYDFDGNMKEKADTRRGGVIQVEFQRQFWRKCDEVQSAATTPR